MCICRHLPFIHDGVDLVISDGKGDGYGCVKKFHDRGYTSERR